MEYVELKPRTRRQGKCVGAALEFFESVDNHSSENCLKEPHSYTYISNDIWFHLANYIAPEDVQSYALICRQSANSINSCRFWLQLYRQYCVKSFGKKWVLQLPVSLQYDQLKGCDRKLLKQRVIQALYYCYEPFKESLKSNYKLSSLNGNIYISSWHKQVRCVWIMCYKFKQKFPLSEISIKDQPIGNSFQSEDGNQENVVQDWESLADEENNNLTLLKPATATVNDLNGISILIVCCDRFIPFPSDIVYNHATSPFLLATSRELLSTDMRSTNLELDFVSTTRDQTITVKYSNIQKFKILPWWHPDFRIFNQCT